MIKLTEILNEILLEKKLCKKGEAYRQRRMKPKSKGGGGEKSSAYLSGRALKVCQGLMEEDDLNEDIDPSEAYNDVDAINTLKDKKRDVAFIVAKGNTPENWKYVQKVIQDNNIKVMYVKGNTADAYVAYLPGSENKAIQLKNLAEKYGGYLAFDATVDDARKIGKLLGYQEDKIEQYIKNRNINESLYDWFKKKWARIDTAGNITGPCGTMKKGKKTTRCLPRAKANSLTKAERAATSKKKAASDKQFVPNTKKAKVKLNK
jgi:translation initiation factor 1 (eIF-1/SUI1)